MHLTEKPTPNPQGFYCQVTMQQDPPRCIKHGPQKTVFHGTLHLLRGVRNQKSASNTKPLDSSTPHCGANDDITPAFWYSPTLFSKKFVLPCKDISSIQSKGLEDP